MVSQHLYQLDEYNQYDGTNDQVVRLVLLIPEPNGNIADSPAADGSRHGGIPHQGHNQKNDAVQHPGNGFLYLIDSCYPQWTKPCVPLSTEGRVTPAILSIVFNEDFSLDVRLISAFIIAISIFSVKSFLNCAVIE